MWKTLITLIFSAAFIAFTASPSAYAQEMSEAEIMKAYGDAFGGTLLNNPAAILWTATGNSKIRKTRVVKAPSIQGKQAYQVKVKSAQRNHWDISLNHNVVKGIKKGDAISVMFWGRAHTPDKDSGVGVVQVRLQQNAAPYTGIAEGIVTLTDKWQIHYVRGIAKRDYKASELSMAFNVGEAKQTLEFGLFLALNKGQNIALDKLPIKSVDLP